MAERLQFLDSIVENESCYGPVRELYRKVSADIRAGRIFPSEGRVWVYDMAGTLLKETPLELEAGQEEKVRRVLLGESTHLETVCSWFLLHWIVWLCIFNDNGFFSVST